MMVFSMDAEGTLELAMMKPFIKKAIRIAQTMTWIQLMISAFRLVFSFSGRVPVF